jgi:hypothetical protein
MSKLNIGLALAGQDAPKTSPLEVTAHATSKADAIWAKLPADAKAIQGGQRFVVIEGRLKTLDAHVASIVASETPPSAEVVAKEFAKILRDWLTPEEMKQVVDYPKSPDADPAVCLSGDFCDSNMAMDEAFKNVAPEFYAEAWNKRDRYLKSGDPAEDAAESWSKMNDIWNEAWTLAKENNFWVSEGVAASKKDSRPASKIRTSWRAKKVKAGKAGGKPQTEDEAYKQLEPGKKSAVVVLNKPGTDGKIYVAKDVSTEQLMKNVAEYALAQWCEDSAEANKMAKILEDCRADKTPLPDSWGTEVSPQAMGTDEIKKHSTETQRIDRLRRADVTGSKKVKAGEAGGVKKFNVMNNIGKSKYVLNFHDGKKTHGDGSPFYDIEIFKNKKDLDTAVGDLKQQGYIEGRLKANEGALREVKVTFADGNTINTNMAKGITDGEIRDYYAIGKKFNLGTGADGAPEDNMQAVTKVEILAKRDVKAGGVRRGGDHPQATDIDWTETPKAFTFTVNPAMQEELKEAVESGKTDQALHDLFEHMIGNSDIDWIQPEEIGALTEAPIFGHIDRDDQGNVVSVGDVWWYPNYMVTDPIAELAETGTVTFEGEPNNGKEDVDIAERTSQMQPSSRRLKAAEGEVEEDGPFIEETVSVKLTWEEAVTLAKRFGYDLEPSFDPGAYDAGYMASDAKNLRLPKKYEGAADLFPEEVAMAAGDAEADAAAVEVAKASKDAFTEALESINVVGEYLDANNEQVQRLKNTPEVVSATWDGEGYDAGLDIVIQNPTHLFNDIINGVGYIAPDLEVREPMSPEDVKGYLGHLKDYFEVYGDSKPEISDNLSPDVSDEDLEYHLEYRLRESGDITLDRAGEAIIEHMDEEYERPAPEDEAEKESWMEEIKEWAVKVAAWTGLDADAIVKASEAKMNSGNPGTAKDMREKEAEGQLRLLESRKVGFQKFLAFKKVKAEASTDSDAANDAWLQKAMTAVAAAFDGEILNRKTEGGWVLAVGIPVPGSHDQPIWMFPNDDETPGEPYISISYSNPNEAGSSSDWFKYWEKDGVSGMIDDISNEIGQPVRGSLNTDLKRVSKLGREELEKLGERVTRQHDRTPRRNRVDLEGLEDKIMQRSEELDTKGNLNSSAPYEAKSMKKGPTFDKSTGFMPREGLYPSGKPVNAQPGTSSSKFKFPKLRKVEGGKP